MCQILLPSNEMHELPASEVDNLCNILQEEWPQSIQAISYLRTCNEWKKKKPNIDISILYYEKNIQSGLFMCIVKSGSQAPVVTTYALDSYEKELENTFSSFLDGYEGIVTLGLISEKHMPIVKKVISAKGFEIRWSINCCTFLLDIDKAKNLEIVHPDSDVEIKPLRKENLNEIYKVWVMKPIHNLEMLEISFELENEYAMGIFCKKTGRLLCRCMRLYNGAISALQTIDEARGKGYAKVLVKHVSKKLAEHSIVPLAYIADFNEASIKVFLGSGYRLVGHNMMNLNIEKCLA